METKYGVLEKKNEMAILGRTEKATIKSMSGVKLIKKRNSQELMDLLDL